MNNEEKELRSRMKKRGSFNRSKGIWYEYIDAAVEAYQYWMNNKDTENWPVFNWQ